jgi:hypothetical protein
VLQAAVFSANAFSVEMSSPSFLFFGFPLSEMLPRVTRAQNDALQGISRIVCCEGYLGAGRARDGAGPLYVSVRVRDEHSRRRGDLEPVSRRILCSRPHRLRRTGGRIQARVVRSVAADKWTLAMTSVNKTALFIIGADLYKGRMLPTTAAQ